MSLKIGGGGSATAPASKSISIGGGSKASSVASGAASKVATPASSKPSTPVGGKSSTPASAVVAPSAPKETKAAIAGAKAEAIAARGAGTDGDALRKEVEAAADEETLKDLYGKDDERTFPSGFAFPFLSRHTLSFSKTDFQYQCIMYHPRY